MFVSSISVSFIYSKKNNSSELDFDFRFLTEPDLSHLIIYLLNYHANIFLWKLFENKLIGNKDASWK